jgi:hypothetical protein
MLPKQFLYILFFACLLSSCVKDLSNDVFTPVNDIEISGIEPAYTVVILDSFKIQPVLTPSLQQQSDDLEFYWILYDPVKTYFSADTLSKERNLDILVNTAPGTYKITYRVKNRHTGVAYRYEFSVTIISELQRGLLVLSDLNGKANVTFVSVTGDLYEDIYENINGEIAGTHPVSIRYTYRAPLDYVVILCDDARGGC